MKECSMADNKQSDTADNQQNDTSRNHRTKLCTLPQDHPLDPTIERVRKKLMRLMIISISITLILILAVLFGVVYKIIATQPASKQTSLISSQSKSTEIAQYTLSLPKGTQILSQSLSEHNIALKILTPEEQIKFIIYNYHTGAITTILSIKTTQYSSPLLPLKNQ